MRLKFRF